MIPDIILLCALLNLSVTGFSLAPLIDIGAFNISTDFVFNCFDFFSTCFSKSLKLFKKAFFKKVFLGIPYVIKVFLVLSGTKFLSWYLGSHLKSVWGACAPKYKEGFLEKNGGIWFPKGWFGCLPSTTVGGLNGFVVSVNGGLEPFKNLNGLKSLFILELIVFALVFILPELPFLLISGFGGLLKIFPNIFFMLFGFDGGLYPPPFLSGGGETLRGVRDCLASTLLSCSSKLSR